MLPKSNVVVPDTLTKELAKPTAGGQYGDSGSTALSKEGALSREGGGGADESALDTQNGPLEVQAGGNSVVKGPSTPKIVGSVPDAHGELVVEETKAVLKTPSRRSARNKLAPSEELSEQKDVEMGQVIQRDFVPGTDDEGEEDDMFVEAKPSISGTDRAEPSGTDKMDAAMQDEPSLVPETPARTGEPSDTQVSSRAPAPEPMQISPLKSRPKTSSPPPLERVNTASSQKSEPPSLAISTRPSQSPEIQVHRPFPTPTTATEAESSLPHTSLPEKSVEPPSPADSAVVASEADPEEPERELIRTPPENHEDEGVGEEEDVRAEELSEIDVGSSSQKGVEGPASSEIASDLIDTADISKSATDEDIGEVEKQLQLETALSKQAEGSRENISPVTTIPESSQGESLPSSQKSEPPTQEISDEHVEMGNILAKDSKGAQHETAERVGKEREDAPADISATLGLVQTAGSPGQQPSKSMPSISTSPEFSKTEITQPVDSDLKQEEFEAANEVLVEDEGGEPISTDPEDLKETLGAVSPIKREEQTPRVASEADADTKMPDQPPVTPPAVPPTPLDITGDAEATAIDNSAIVETPMSVDGQAPSPTSVQQPLTTAALESINTNVSTPATRTSSRREKRPSITGGLQLAKIVFHGRSTTTQSTSKSDAPANELSPAAAPTPARVGTRSGSISTPARMNSRSLEAQRISSLAELKEQHQQQLREQHDVVQQRKHTAEKPKMDVFDYLAAVTASEPLQNSLATSHKTLSTSAFQLLRREKQAIQALTEIQELQKEGKWSLTQPARAIEPSKQMVHWDYMVREIKWMSKDFKEGRKWNIVVAKKLADACRTWHEASDAEKRAMCVIRTPSGKPLRARHVAQVPTPELVPSDQHSEDDDMADDDEGDHMRDDFVHRLHEVENPGNLFALGADDVIFEILHNTMTDRMLAELPMFEAPRIEPSGEKSPQYFDGYKNNEPLGPSAGLKRTLWEAPIEEGPPVKKSRFSYDPDYKLLDSDDEDEDRDISPNGIASRGIARSGSPILQPENTTVALFKPEFQPVLQRLHNAHMFRPPQEMPPATFFEYRNPSQWTAEEDKELVAAVKKYNHNWWLVSQVMQPRSFLQSGADRRSLWECFERWVMLEPQNAEVIKGPFFKPVQQRLELAARAPTHAGTLQQQAAAATPGGHNTSGQPGSATGSVPGQPPKKRTSQPVRVERKRNTRTLSMLEQMRKLAKKREVQATKQAQSTSIALKKQQEQSVQSQSTPKAEQYTPQQVSRMKHEKELLHRQQAQMAQMAQIQRRQAQAAAAAAATQPPGQQPTASATPTAATTAAAATPNPNATVNSNTTTTTPTNTNSNSNNTVPPQSRSNLQVPNIQNNPAASVPTTAQQSLLAAQQQRQLLASANSAIAIQQATQQVNQQLRQSGHTIATNGQNGPTSLTPDQYRMLIQARVQANALNLQKAQQAAAVQAAQAQALAAGGAAGAHSSPQVSSANASHIHAMQAAAAAARAHNSNASAGQVQAAQAAAAGGQVASGPSARDVISPQVAMMRIKQHFPTIGDDYIQRVVMQHQAQVKQMGRELTYGHISNLIQSLAAQVAAASGGGAASPHAQQHAQNQLHQQQGQLAGQAQTAGHHGVAGMGVGVGHVGAGGIHHPHTPVNRSGGSPSTQQILNQLRIAQTRAPSSSPMMGNATPVMQGAGATSGTISRGSSATPMQRGGSYHTPTPGPSSSGQSGQNSGGAQGQTGGQGSPRTGTSQVSGIGISGQ
ncbi:hypothetical protein ABW19_dt0207982 [Dactylella cylindrospora]|nr:hypothetical protein ABW19_dt0207982 [Dactylella cylindrospora]